VLGEQLMVSAFSRDLRLSATPVREALSRLAGEGLIDDRRGMGYFAWRLDAIDLVELYDLQSAYLDAALTRADDPGVVSVRAANGVAEVEDAEYGLIGKVEAIFNSVIVLGRSTALMRAHRMLADRLAPFRRAEATALTEITSELEALEAIVRRPDRDAVADALRRYHDRRSSRAAEVVATMRAQSPAI
jgi:hypothetical protein